MLIKYITVIAWVFGIASTLMWCILSFSLIMETDAERVRRAMRGEIRRPALPVFIVVVLCWSWVIVS